MAEKETEVGEGKTIAFRLDCLPFPPSFPYFYFSNFYDAFRILVCKLYFFFNLLLLPLLFFYNKIL